MYHIHVLARVYMHVRAYYWQRCPPSPQQDAIMILQTRFLWGSNIVFAEIARVSSVCSRDLRDLMSISPSNLLMLRNFENFLRAGLEWWFEGQGGRFSWRVGACPSLETMHLVFLQIREKAEPPFPPISRSVWYLEKKHTIVSLVRISGTF